MSEMNINIKWAQRISKSISEMGIDCVCICPGSRNTPLTLAFTGNKDLICSSHIDERSASFFALGISKKTSSPAVIVSTSGTAVANFLPSVIEASLSKTPLLIITADRPSHLVHTGENQTINQKNIFGGYVRGFKDLGLPNNKVILESIVISFIDLANGGADTPPGPVHLNVPFDEPLIDDSSFIDTNSIQTSIDTKQTKYSFKSFVMPQLDDSVIICGEMCKSSDLQKILDLSEHLNAPILADPTSNIRYFTKHPNIISSYNLFINEVQFNPGTIIRFGSKPTSKSLCSILKKHNRVYYIDRYETFNDDSIHQINSSVSHFIDHILGNTKKVVNNSYLKKLLPIQNKINTYMNQLTFDKYRCEGVLINNILNSVDENSNIFIGNSMAIREMDDLTINMDKKINIYANRGASGIDGLVSTALGMTYSAKENTNIAILGDLSFYHDMNGLLAAKQMNINMIFIVLNNNGGGIFSKLDIPKIDSKTFNKFWTTPLNLDIDKIADLYDFEYAQLKTLDDIKTISNSSSHSIILDYRIDIKKSIQEKKKIEKEIKDLVRN